MERLALFEPMAADRRVALCRAARVLEVARGQDLDPARGTLIVLLHGAVAMTIEEAGRHAVVAMIAEPDVLNLDAVMVREDGRVGWRALAPSRILLIPGDDFRAALLADPSLAARAFVELTLAYRRLLDWAASQRLRSAQQRVAAYLLSLAPARAGEAVVDLPYEKHLLASLLGMTPENLSRALGRLASYGVRVRGAKVRLERIDALRDLVALTPTLSSNPEGCLG
jgi:CRP/FNR family transcriptional activator FtrB